MIVYIYTFPNGKKYVGQTTQTLEIRARLGEGYISSPAVYSAIKKYGYSNLKIETFPCQNQEELNQLERYYIQLYNTTDNKYGYNLTLGGEGNTQYDRTAICKLWKEGLGFAQIAKEIGCSRHTAKTVIEAEGLYDIEEVKLRIKKQNAATSGEKLKEYYKNPTHQKDRIKNGLKGAKVRSKAVAVFKDKEKTQLVGVYPSGRQCAKALNIDHSSPSYALNHNNYSSGYYFYFLEDIDPKECTYEKAFGNR